MKHEHVVLNPLNACAFCSHDVHAHAFSGSDSEILSSYGRCLELQCSCSHFITKEKPEPKRNGSYITTYTGKQFLLFEPTVDMIDIEDIAHALSMICHFGGHMSSFFSVAQHSILVAEACKRQPREVHPNLVQWGLLHDAAEAYIGDMTRPLKYAMPAYRDVEARIMRVIVEKFHLDWPEPKELKAIDDSIIKLEANLYMNNAVLLARTGELAVINDAPMLPLFYTDAMSCAQARFVFMNCYRELFV